MQWLSWGTGYKRDKNLPPGCPDGYPEPWLGSGPAPWLSPTWQHGPWPVSCRLSRGDPFSEACGKPLGESPAAAAGLAELWRWRSACCASSSISSGGGGAGAEQRGCPRSGRAGRGWGERVPGWGPAVPQVSAVSAVPPGLAAAHPLQQEWPAVRAESGLGRQETAPGATWHLFVENDGLGVLIVVYSECRLLRWGLRCFVCMAFCTCCVQSRAPTVTESSCCRRACAVPVNQLSLTTHSKTTERADLVQTFLLSKREKCILQRGTKIGLLLAGFHGIGLNPEI